LNRSQTAIQLYKLKLQDFIMLSVAKICIAFSGTVCALQSVNGAGAGPPDKRRLTRSMSGEAACELVEVIEDGKKNGLFPKQAQRTRNKPAQLKDSDGNEMVDPSTSKFDDLLRQSSSEEGNEQAGEGSAGYEESNKRGYILEQLRREEQSAKEEELKRKQQQQMQEREKHKQKRKKEMKALQRKAARADGLEKENESLEETNEALKVENGLLEQENEDLKKQIRSLEEHNKALEQGLDGIQHTVSALRKRKR
jgi:hypothetical protein